MLKNVSLAVLIAAGAVAAGSAFAAEPAMVADTAKGKTLVDANGMTLYTFDKDSDGKSACYDKCAVNWPPLAAEAGAMAEGEWTVITRDDGTMQWAYEGKPLYTFIKDTAKGDVTGDGLADGTWHVAQP